MNTIPPDLFRWVLCRCSVRVVYMMTRLLPSLNSYIFWNTYLSDTRLQELLLHCAENDDWLLFRYLYSTKFRTKDGETLKASYETLLKSFSL